MRPCMVISVVLLHFFLLYFVGCALPGDISAKSSTIDKELFQISESIDEIKLRGLLGTTLDDFNQDTTKPFVVLIYLASWCPSCVEYVDKISESISEYNLSVVLIWSDVALSNYCDLAKPATNIICVRETDSSFVDLFFVGDEHASSITLPYAVVLEHKSVSSPFTKIWSGPAIQSRWYDIDLIDVIHSLEKDLGNIASLRNDYFITKRLEKYRLSWNSNQFNGSVSELLSIIAEIKKYTLYNGTKYDALSLLNNISWDLISQKDQIAPLFGLGKDVSKYVYESGGQDIPSFSDTYAKVLFLSGKVDEAVREQERVVNLQAVSAYQFDVEPGYFETLVQYKKASDKYAQNSTLEEKTAHHLDCKKALPGPLPKEVFAEELNRIVDLLENNYVGYWDTDAKLSGKSTTWRTFANALRRDVLKNSSSYLTNKEVETYLIRLLSVAEDKHLAIRRCEDGQQVYTSVHSGYAPYFTDLRVREEAGEFKVVSAPKELKKLIGSAVMGLEVQDRQQQVVDRVALFKTIPISNTISNQEYLIGIVKPSGDAYPVRSTFRTGLTSIEIDLPTHRGRATTASADGIGRGAAFRLQNGPSFSLLSIRRFWDIDANAFLETASELRKSSFGIVDLRGNPGGNNGLNRPWAAAMDSRIDPQRDFVGSCQLKYFNGKRHWRCLQRNTPRRKEPAIGENYSRPKYIVLTDKKTASAAEDLAILLTQSPSIRILGENTAGAQKYGNVKNWTILNGAFLLQFGTKMFISRNNSIEECKGLFPDYWIDRPLISQEEFMQLGI